MDKPTYNSLRIRFSLLAKGWAVPANQNNEQRRARSIIQSPTADDVEDLISLMMLAYIEADTSTREALFSKGNEGKLFYHIKNKLGSAARQISVQLHGADDGDDECSEIADEAADPLKVLVAQEDSASRFEDFAAQLDEINGLNNEAWAGAVGLQESEARAIKYRVKSEQIDNLLAEAARAAGITKVQLGRLKAQYLTTRPN